MPASFPGCRLHTQAPRPPPGWPPADWRQPCPSGRQGRSGSIESSPVPPFHLFQEKGKESRHGCRLPRPGATRDHAQWLQNGHGRRDPLPIRLPVAARKEPSEPFPKPHHVDPGGRELRSLPQETSEALLATPVTIEIEAGPVKNERPPIAGGADDGACAQRSHPRLEIGAANGCLARGNRAACKPGQIEAMPPRPRRGSPGRRQA